MIHFSKVILAALMVSLPVWASAHAGHGHFSWDDIRHYVFSPEHTLPVVAIVLLGITAYKAYLRRADRKTDN